MKVFLTTGCALLLGVVACGSAADNGSGASDVQDQSGGSGSGSLAGNGTTSGSIPTLAAPSASAGAGDVGGVAPGAACATSSASVSAPPVHLVFLIDRSGSMGNSQQAGQNLEVRWKPVVAGLDAFFADAANANVNASITFFAQSDSECSADAYATPKVSMRQLPDSTSFSAALDVTQPKGGTPTKPALDGAIAYAESVKAGLPAGEKVAIVLATDGDPNDCSSTADNVAQAAGAVKNDIATYVIGVGPDTTNLDTIAQGGGTGHAIMIATSNPTQVSADLRAAVSQIKAAQLGCSYPLPAPPDGTSLDVNAVNVDYIPATGQAQTLAYSADCSNPQGWHYDNVAAPKGVELCAASCSTVNGDTTGGKIELVFGCAIDAVPGTELPGGGVR